MHVSEKSLISIGIAAALGASLGTTMSASYAQDNVFPGRWITSQVPGVLSPLPEAREGYCLGSQGNKLIMTHGFSGGDTSDVRIYDTSADVWISGTSSPNPRSEGIGVTHGNLVYCIGGRLAGVTDLAEAYDAGADAWTTLAPMPTPRAGLAAAAHGNKIYTFGGNSVGAGPCSGPGLNVAEVYDIATDSWSSITPPPVPVTHALASAKGNKIILMGGCTNANVPVNVVQIYTPNKDSWSVGSPMPTPRASFAVGTLGNTVYAIAGWNGINLNVVEAYDIDKDAWVGPLSPKPTPASEAFAERQGSTLYVPGSGAFGNSSAVFEAMKRK